MTHGTRGKSYLNPFACDLNSRNDEEAAANTAELRFNTKKTVTMIFNPHRPHKRLHSVFPCFLLSGSKLSTVSHFKYLGHMNTLLRPWLHVK